jgi:hypothetical protein
MEFASGGRIQTFPVIVLIEKGVCLIPHKKFDEYVKILKEVNNGNQQQHGER